MKPLLILPRYGLLPLVGCGFGIAIQAGFPLSAEEKTSQASSTSVAQVVISGSSSVSGSPHVQGNVTVTTTGPDGKPHTVFRSFSGTGTDGKPLAFNIHKQAERTEKVPFIGLSTEEAPEILCKHLPVPPGIGLVVSEVIKDSPAEKAGLHKDDLLLRFEDQWMVNPAQLRTLTHTKKPGDTVRLSVIQKGKETTLSVQLGEREEDAAHAGRGERHPLWGKEGMPEWLSQAREKWLSNGNARELWENFRKLMREKEPTAPGQGQPLPPPLQHRDFQRELDKLEEEIGRLRVEIHRQSRETPERHEPRSRGTHPDGNPDRKEGRSNPGSGERRNPTAPFPPPPRREGDVSSQPAPVPSPHPIPRPPERPQ